MSDDNDNKVLKEIRQRVIRTETRIMSLGSKLGVDLKDTDNDDIMVDVGNHIVDIIAMDVAITSIVNKCRALGLQNTHVKVYCHDKVVAERLYV